MAAGPASGLVAGRKVAVHMADRRAAVDIEAVHRVAGRVVVAGRREPAAGTVSRAVAVDIVDIVDTADIALIACTAAAQVFLKWQECR